MTGGDHLSVQFVDQDLLPSCSLEVHYQIAQSKKHYQDISAWLLCNRNDVALQVHPCVIIQAILKLNKTCVWIQDFLPKLKDHVLGHLLDNNAGDLEVFTQLQRNALSFINNRIYQHRVLCVNYTTYNLWWAQDLLNPSTHADIMLLSHKDIENPHPYWYARIVGIFHANIQYHGPEVQDPAPQCIDFLWVQWFAWHKNIKSGWAARHLPCVGFYPQGESDVFSFVNPCDVIHGMHLIPAFRYGLTSELLPPSIVHQESDNNKDWDWYYVNM